MTVSTTIRNSRVVNTARQVVPLLQRSPSALPVGADDDGISPRALNEPGHASEEMGRRAGSRRAISAVERRHHRTLRVNWVGAAGGSKSRPASNSTPAALEATARPACPWLTAGSVVLTLVALLLLANRFGEAAVGCSRCWRPSLALGTTWQRHSTFHRATKPYGSGWPAHFLTGTIACPILLAYWLIARWFLPDVLGDPGPCWC